MDDQTRAELTRLANKITRTEFKLPELSDDHPLLPRLLKEELAKLTDIPELRDNESILILSDYGGQHKQAKFKTYTFLICGFDKLGMFFQEMKKLRQQHKLDDPFKEYEYKELRYGPIKRSLERYLEYANTLVPGFLVNIAIDKQIQSVFGRDLKETARQLGPVLKENELGEWEGEAIEKVLRICHPIALFLAVLSKPGQKLLWMSDHDVINEDGKNRDFSHTQKIFLRVLRIYTENDYDIYGFAKPFDKSAMTADLLSLTDLSAGAFQDLLKGHYERNTMDVSEQKAEVIRWMGREGLSLRKFHFIVLPDGNSWSYGRVHVNDRKKQGTEIPIFVNRR